ncbi:MAG: carboxypeptidase regulatory-like domain-containing protein, partial [Pirellulaceae bacterium]
VEVVYQLTTDPRSNAAEPHFRQATSDDDGKVVLELEDGVRRLAITCRAPDRVAHALVRYSERPDQALEFPFEQTVKLSVGRQVSGTVHDDAGTPVGGVSILVESLPGDVPGLTTDHDHFVYGRTASDDAGRWTVTAFPVETELYPRLVFDHSDFVGPTIVDEVQADTAVHLPESASVNGTVTDSQSQPIAGATVRFADFVWASHVPTATTDANGRYTIKGCWPGKASLTVQADGNAPQSQIALASLNPEDSFDFQLRPSPGFSGQLVDPGGQPVAGAIVRCAQWNGRRNLRWETRSDDAGRFEWSGAPNGEFSLDIFANGFLIVSDYVVNGEQGNAPITLRPVFQVAGRVLDADSGQPVSNVRMQLGPARKDGTYALLVAGVDSEKFAARFERLAESYQIVLSARGYETIRLDPLAYADDPADLHVIMNPVREAAGASRYSGWDDIAKRVDSQEFDMQEAAALSRLRELGALGRYIEWGEIQSLQIRLVDEHVAGHRRGGVEEIRREPDRKSWQGAITDLALLKELTNVWLTLDGWEIDADLLHAVGELGPLESLELRGVWDMEPEEFSAFESLSNVRQLRINGGWQAFPQEGLVALSRLPNLESLEFRGDNQLTGEMFAGLFGDFKSLVEFRCHAMVDLNVLDEISQLESLESLMIGCEFDDELLLKLPENPRMRILFLYGSGITDAGLATLIERYPDLESLSLRETGISRRGVRLLTQRPLAKLRQLTISDGLRPEIVQLQRAHPNCSITQYVTRPGRPRSAAPFELRNSERRQSLNVER